MYIFETDTQLYITQLKITKRRALCGIGILVPSTFFEIAASSRIMRHVAKLKSSQTGSLDNEVTVFKWLPQSPDLYSIELLMDVMIWKIYRKFAATV